MWKRLLNYCSCQPWGGPNRFLYWKTVAFFLQAAIRGWETLCLLQQPLTTSVPTRSLLPACLMFLCVRGSEQGTGAEVGLCAQCWPPAPLALHLTVYWFQHTATPHYRWPGLWHADARVKGAVTSTTVLPSRPYGQQPRSTRAKACKGCPASMTQAPVLRAASCTLLSWGSEHTTQHPLSGRTKARQREQAYCSREKTGCAVPPRLQLPGYSLLFSFGSVT